MDRQLELAVMKDEQNLIEYCIVLHFSEFMFQLVTERSKSIRVCAFNHKFEILNLTIPIYSFRLLFLEIL